MLGPVRFEWVFDGEVTWAIQFHKGGTRSVGPWIVPGNAQKWIPFDASEGLEALRTLLERLERDSGLVLHGNVGQASHLAELVRRSGVPSKCVPN